MIDQDKTISVTRLPANPHREKKERRLTAMDDTPIPSETPIPGEAGSAAAPDMENTDQLRQKTDLLELQIQQLTKELDEARSTPHRRRLPATRQSLTHQFTVGTYEGYMTVGLYEDGRPGEVFLTMAKEGSTIGGLVDTIGILTSLALQYGVPVEILARKFEFARFEPAGWTHNPEIRSASSVVDYVFRWLGTRFSETYREERLHHADDPPLPDPTGRTDSAAIREN